MEIQARTIKRISDALLLVQSAPRETGGQEEEEDEEEGTGGRINEG